MIEPVEKLLKLVGDIEKNYHEIDEYKCRHKPNYSWADLVRMELSKKYFSDLEKIHLRNAIETLEFIESQIR